MNEPDIPLTIGIKVALVITCIVAGVCNWIAVALLGPH